MALDNVKNFIRVLIPASYADTDTSITLESGAGASLPAPPFNLVWWDAVTYASPSLDPNREIVRVTAISGDVLTVERAQEGTTAVSHVANGRAVLAVTAKTIEDINLHITDTNNPHGVTAGQIGALTSVAGDTSPQLGGSLDAGSHAIYFDEVSTTGAINWNSSNKQSITLTADVTLTFTDPTKPCNLILKIVQDSNGGHTITFPSTVKWVNATAPSFTTTAGGIDIVELYYDGGSYYAVALTNFG